MKRSPVSRTEPRIFLRHVAILAATVFALAGCAHRVSTQQPPASVPIPQPVPPETAPPVASSPLVEEGVASWYGNPFDGRRTSNGEIYDMHAMTAAHRTLPFGSVVRVTNLSNGQQAELRVNDRGPFVANRIIDVSQAAAKALGMIGTGTAMVRLEVVGGPNPQIGYFCVQVGAFRSEENAEALRDQLASRYTPINILPFQASGGRFYRVRIGRMSSEDEARQLETELRAAGQSLTFVVRLDQ